jgi:hypothetical protein
MHLQDEDYSSGRSQEDGANAWELAPDSDDIVVAEVIDERIDDRGSPESTDDDVAGADEHADGQVMTAAPADLAVSQEWHDIQATFVDDPRRAVRQAAEAADDALGALVATMQQQLTALTSPVGDAGQDTEQLRIALQRYRVIWQGAQDLGQRLPQADVAMRS